MSIDHNKYSETQEFIKTLQLIKDFNTLKNGDKIFHKYSYKVEYVSNFDHIEYNNEVPTIFYRNYFGNLFSTNNVVGYWYYYNV